jgi:starch synthase
MNLSDPGPAPRALFVAPEAAPFTKTGGLGDVCAALPAALRAIGIDVRVLIPGYPRVLGGLRLGEAVSFSALGFRARIATGSLPGSDVPFLVLDCPELYARSGGPYQDASGEDWPDNPLRFGLLSRTAALLGSAASPLAAWRPEVVHCHDWPGALAAAWLHFEPGPRAASLVTIHNLAFQGNFDARPHFERLGLPERAWSIDGVEFHGRLSFLKGGLAFADLINTVSPRYAREIQTAEFGCGLDGLMRHRAGDLCGILNGIDVAAWNPADDPHLARRYAAESLPAKRVNKAELQRRMGLEEEAEVPLIGQVGRLTGQKGIDLLLDAAEDLAARAQLVFLGSGERPYEAALRDLAARHPGRVGVRIGFDEALAHLVEAGSDLFVMPSRYEPCGLNQMYSQRYGTPPVVRATGGLADSVEDGVTGFAFENLDKQDLLSAVDRALTARRDPARWQAIQRAGMARDFSWTAAARRYADLYLRLATLERA